MYNNIELHTTIVGYNIWMINYEFNWIIYEMNNVSMWICVDAKLLL